MSSITFGVGVAVCYCATSKVKTAALREFAWLAELVPARWVV